MADPHPSFLFSNLLSSAAWRRRLFGQGTAVKDRLEEQLHRGAQLDSRTAELLHDYLQFKNETFDKRFGSLVWLARVQETHPSIQRRLRPEEGLTFTEFLRDELTAKDNPQVTLCMTSANNYNRSIFKFKSKIFVSASRLRRMQDAPALSIQYTVAQEWKLPKDVRETCIVKTDSPIQKLTPYTSFPMRREHGNDFSLDDPNSASVRMQWHSEAPKHKPDFDIYIWQQHTKIPKQERATISINKISEEEWKVLIAYGLTEKNSAIYPDAYFKVLEEQLSTRINKPPNNPPNNPSNNPSNNPPSNRTRILACLLTAFTLLIRDTSSFLDEMLDLISQMKLEGRRRPAGSKLNFLLHLDDYRQQSCISLRDASVSLTQLSNYIIRQPEKVDSSLQAWCDELSADIQRIQEHFAEIGNILKELRTTMKEQIDYKAVSQTRVLTILAAIYLPFSFISGMFGMNIRDPLWNAPKNITGNQSAATAQSRASITSGFQQATAVIDALSNAKTSFFEDEKARSSTNSLTNSSALTQSGVDAIVSAINALSSPSTHLWSFKQFWYIAAAVTIVTILLPLVAGPILRTTLQSFYYYKPYWRISLFVLVLAVAIMLDILTPPLAFLIVFAVPQFILVSWRLYLAHVRDRHKKRWIGFATLLGVCIVANTGVMGSSELPRLGVIPPTYLFIVWIQADPPLITNVIAGWFKDFQASKAYQDRERIFIIFWVVLALAANAGLSYVTPGLIYPMATGIPFSLYGLDELLKQRRPIEICRWLLFMGIIAFSLFFTVVGFGSFVGLSGLLPSLTLGLFNKDKIMTRLRRIFSKAPNRNPPLAATVDPEPGIQLTVLQTSS